MKRLKLKRSGTVFAHLLLLIVLQSACGAKEPPKVVLFVVDRITWWDIVEVRPPTVMRMVQEGGIALLNVQSYGPASSLKSCATISAGMKAFADERAATVLCNHEPFENGTAAQAFERLTACPASDKALLCPYIGGLALQNQEKIRQDLMLGLLGESLHRSGILSAAVGCSDLTFTYEPGTIYRHPAFIALTALGYAYEGEVGKGLLMRDPSAPFGLRTEPEKLFAAVQKVWHKVGLLVIDYADTFRADLYSDRAWDVLAKRHRHLALKRADAFLNRLQEQLFNPRRDLLFLLALTPPHKQKYQLAPLIAYGKGVAPQSLLTSGTTRRPGVVMLTDIAPKVLNFFNAPKVAPVVGQVIKSQAPSRWQTPLDRVLSIASVCAVTDGGMRRWGVSILCLIQAAAFALSAMLLLLQISDSRWWNRAKMLVLYMMMLPLSYFLLNAFIVVLPHWAMVLLLGLMFNGLATLAMARWLPDANSQVMILTLATAAAIVTDILIGSQLNFNTMLGYSPYFGVRYYGMSNITMAMTVAAAFIGCTAICQRLEADWKRYAVVWSFFLLTLLIIGLPRLGANIGGALATLVTFGAGLYGLRGERVRLARLAAFFGFGLLLLVGYTLYDLHFGTERASHLGRLVVAVQTGGWETLSWMATLKVNAWVRAWHNPYWNTALIASILLAVIALWARTQEISGQFRKDATFRMAVIGILFGATAACLFNDTGAQPPATFFLYGWGGLLLISQTTRSYPTNRRTQT